MAKVVPQAKDTPIGKDKPIAGDLLVWWMPQIPMLSFDVKVNSLREARLVLDMLANYDLFQFENKIKPDYANMGGLSVFEDGEWEAWEDPDTYVEVTELTEERIAEMDQQRIADRAK